MRPRNQIVCEMHALRACRPRVPWDDKHQEFLEAVINIIIHGTLTAISAVPREGWIYRRVQFPATASLFIRPMNDNGIVAAKLVYLKVRRLDRFSSLFCINVCTSVFSNSSCRRRRKETLISVKRGVTTVGGWRVQENPGRKPEKMV